MFDCLSTYLSLLAGGCSMHTLQYVPNQKFFDFTNHLAGKVGREGGGR